MKNPLSAILIATVAAMSAVGAVSGCGSGSDKPQSIASPERVNQLVEMRQIFDKSGGNWDGLSAEDKAKYTQLAGDDAKAKMYWDKMLHPAGGAEASGKR